MAFEKTDKDNLKSLAQSLGRTNLGGINMPSGNKDDEEVQYSLMDLMAGICSSALFVNGSNKNKDNIKTFLSDSKKSYLYSINKSLTTIVNYLKSKNGVTNNLKSNIQSAITQSLKDVISDKAIMVRLTPESNELFTSPLSSNQIESSANTSGKHIIEFTFQGNGMNEATLRALADLINIGDANYNTPDELNISKLADHIKKISNKMGSDLGLLATSVSTLAEKITEVNDEQLKKVSNLLSIITSINNMFDDIKDINVPAINMLIRVTSKGGEIDQILDNLQDLGKVFESKAKDSIYLLNTFFSSLTSVTNISLMKRINMLMNIKFIRAYMINDIKGLLDEINKEFGNIGQVTQDGKLSSPNMKGLNNIVTLFDFISAISDKPMANIGKVKVNIKFIKKYLISSITDLIRDINNEFKGIEEDGGNVIEQFTNFFDKLFNIFGSDNDTLYQLRYGSRVVYKIMIGDKNSVRQLIQDLGEIQQDGLDERLSNLQTNMQYVMSILKVLTIMDRNKLKELNLNIDLAIDNFNLIGKLIRIINNFKATQDNVLTIIKESYINGLFDINDSIIAGMSNADAKNVNKYIEGSIAEVALLQSFVNSIKNLSAVITSLTDEDKNAFGKVESLLLELDAITLHDISPEDIAKKLGVSKESIEGVDRLYEFVSQLIITAKGLDLISTLGPTISKGINVINTIIDKLNNSVKDIDDKKVKSIANLFSEVNKLIIMCAFTLLIGAFAAAALDIKGIIEFGTGMLLMLGGVSLIIKQLSKMDEKQLKNSSKTLLAISAILLTGAFILGYVSEHAQSIEWEYLGIFAAGLVAFISVTMLSLSIIFKIFKVKDVMPNLFAFSVMILTSAFVLIAATHTAAEVQWPLLFAFAGSIGLLILLTAAALSIMHTPIGTMAFSGAASLSLLIISCALAIGLGAFIATSIPIPTILAFGVILGLFIDSILLTLSDRTVDIKMGFDAAAGLGVLILMSTAAMILGPLGMQAIDNNFMAATVKVLAFAVILGAFVGGVAWAYNSSAQGVDGAIQTAKHLSLLVAVSAATLILGTALLLGLDTNPWLAYAKVLGFTVILGLFIAGISWAYGKASQKVNGNITTAKQLAILVAVSAATMILGTALVTQIDDNYWKGLIKIGAFAAVLGLFVWGVSKAYSSASEDIANSIKPALALSIVITTTALALSLPFLIFKKNGVNLAEVAILAVLMAGTVWAFGEVIQNINKTFGNKGKEAAVAIVVLGSLIGVIFGLSLIFDRLIDISNKIEGFGGFLKLAGVVGLMIAAVLGFEWLLKRLGKIDEKIIFKGIGTLAGITIILFGLTKVFRDLASLSNEMGDFKNGLLRIGGMLLLMIATVGLIGLLIKEFGKIAITEILKGVAVIGAAGLIVYGMAWLFSYIKANFDPDDRKQLFFTVMAMFGTMALVILGTGVIGALGLMALPFLIAGAVIIVICGALIWGMAELFKHILDIDDIYKFSNIKVDKDGKVSGETTLIKSIDGMFGVIQHIMNKIRALDLTGAGPNGSMWAKLKGAVKGGLKTGALAAILLVVNEIAVTMYVLGRVMKSLGDNPIQLMESAKTTINSMFDIWADKDLQSKLEVVADNKKLFEKTSKALNKMGKAISSIAIGVQQYASLSIPTEFDSEGNPIAYRPMNDEDFTSAAHNIALIITTVGGAIMGLFTGKDANGNDMELSDSQKEVVKLMMESGGFLNLGTKFGKIINSTSRLGPMISKIAEGIQQYASLAVPTGFDKEGNPTGWRSMNDDDFTSAAHNIALIITTVGGAIMGLFTGKDANGNDLHLSPTQLETVKEMMKTGGGVAAFFTGKTKFGQIIGATKGLGEVISSIAEGVLLYASMQIPDKWDDKGNPIHFKDIDKDKVFTEAAKNINEIITLIGNTLLTTASEHPELFKDSLLADSPIVVATKAATKMGAIVAGLAEGIQAYANLRIPDKWDNNGKPIHWVEVKNKNAYFGEAASNIGEIVTTIGKTLTSVAQNDKRGIFDIGSGSPVTRVTDAIVKVSGIIGKIADQIGHYATGEYPKLEWVSGKLTTTGYYHISSSQFEDARTAITAALTCIAGALFDTVNSDKNLKKLVEGKKLDEFSKGIETMVNSITKIANSVNSLIKLQLTPEGFQPLLDVIQLYLNEIVQLHYYGTTYELTKDLKNTLFGYEEYIGEWIKLGQKAAETGQEGYDILKTSIDNVNLAIANINNTDVFKQHVNTVKDYVSAIDAIDISKVESLTSLIDAVNTLGDKMGNFDEFTTVLAEKMTVVLTNLAAKLDEAKKTIKDADALHDKREKLIKNSVGTIKSLMKQSMVVKIEQEEQSANPSLDTTVTGPGASGGDVTPDASVTENTNINNNNVNKSQGENSGGGRNSNISETQLAIAIKNEMAKLFAQRGIGH